MSAIKNELSFFFNSILMMFHRRSIRKPVLRRTFFYLFVRCNVAYHLLGYKLREYNDCLGIRDSRSLDYGDLNQSVAAGRHPSNIFETITDTIIRSLAVLLGGGLQFIISFYVCQPI